MPGDAKIGGRYIRIVIGGTTSGIFQNRTIGIEQATNQIEAAGRFHIKRSGLGDVNAKGIDVTDIIQCRRFGYVECQRWDRGCRLIGVIVGWVCRAIENRRNLWVEIIEATIVGVFSGVGA